MRIVIAMDSEKVSARPPTEALLPGTLEDFRSQSPLDFGPPK